MKREAPGVRISPPIDTTETTTVDGKKLAIKIAAIAAVTVAFHVGVRVVANQIAKS